MVTQTGKRLFVLNDPTAKNAYLVSAKQSSVLLWEQNQEFGEGVASTIAYKNIKDSGPAETKFVAKSKNGTNATGLVLDNQLLIAYEVKNANSKNSIEWQTVEL